MDRFPLLADGVQTGELTAAADGLYIRFHALCDLPAPGLYRAFAVGERGELRLGVLEPDHARFSVLRRISAREAGEAGRLLRGEIRPCGEADPSRWQSVARPEELLRTPFLREQLRGLTGVLTRREGGVLFLALPFSARHPFLLTSLFCFASVRQIGAKKYAVFAFDRDENPVFRQDFS